MSARSDSAPPFVIGVFANALLEQDYELAHSCLSHGLQGRISVQELRSTILEAEEDSPVPDGFSWRRSGMTFSDWMSCNDAASSPDVTAENFVSWSCIVFNADFESCYQLWCVLISEGGQQRIGFFEITDPD